MLCVKRYQVTWFKVSVIAKDKELFLYLS